MKKQKELQEQRIKEGKAVFLVRKAGRNHFLKSPGAMPFAPSSVRSLLVVRPGAPSSVLVPSSDARSP